MKVLFTPEVRSYFTDLTELLYEKEYFGFVDSALQYARELFLDIQDSLPQRKKTSAPLWFNRYGKDMYYSVFKKNRGTQWYVFFTIYEDDKGEITYLVTIVR